MLASSNLPLTLNRINCAVLSPFSVAAVLSSTTLLEIWSFTEAGNLSKFFIESPAKMLIAG